MLILFNWKKIYTHSNGKIRKLLDIIYFITYAPLPEDDYDKFYTISLEKWTGSSFLVNPELLFQNRPHFKDKELAEYIALASRRSYADYKATKTTTLDFRHISTDKSYIKENRLLQLQDDYRVHFLYESVH